MRVLLLGATGLVGQSVLRECLADERVTDVVALGRSPSLVHHGKLRNEVRADLFSLGEDPVLADVDVCFWCLGVPSAGKTEEEYRRITMDLTLAVARPLAERNPEMVFVFISGRHASPESSIMWTRVKGCAEVAIRQLTFRSYVFRPGLVLPTHGERAKSRRYRLMYRILSLFSGLIRRLLSSEAIGSEDLARAALKVAKLRPEERVFENRQIVQFARARE